MKKAIGYLMLLMFAAIIVGVMTVCIGIVATLLIVLTTLFMVGLVVGGLHLICD